VTEFGIRIDDKEKHWKKHRSGMEVIEFGILIVFN
jgi:hypothetical protein